MNSNHNCPNCGAEIDCPKHDPIIAACTGESPSSGSKKRLIAEIVENWDGDAASVACDAVLDLLSDQPAAVAPILQAICAVSDYWAEQIGRAILDLPSDDNGDFDQLAEMLKDMGASGKGGQAVARDCSTIAAETWTCVPAMAVNTKEDEALLEELIAMDESDNENREVACHCEADVPENVNVVIEAPWDEIRQAIEAAGYEATDKRLEEVIRMMNMYFRTNGGFPFMHVGMVGEYILATAESVIDDLAGNEDWPEGGDRV